MWPLFRRAKKTDSPPIWPRHQQEDRRRPMRFAQLVEEMGDFGDLGHHDTALKFWLPEPAAEALKEIAGRNGESMSELLRQFLAVHCYGIYAFLVMNDAIPGLFKEPRIYFSRAAPDELSLEDETAPVRKRIDTYWVPELGKNIAPIKVWIPGRMHGDLQVLAEHVEIPLSQYVREIVISRYLGHGTLPKRPEMMAADPLPSAEEWCEGREVPMRQVELEEYYRWDGGKQRTEWVEE